MALNDVNINVDVSAEIGDGDECLQATDQADARPRIELTSYR